MDSTRWGTAHLSNEEFVEAFESCRLPASQFHHADHIRLAWIYLGQLSAEEAAERIGQAIRRFAAHNGVSQKYHRTITLAWMRLVAAARMGSPRVTRFEEFAELHPELLDMTNLKRYYTAERLATVEARTAWVEPNLCDLP